MIAVLHAPELQTCSVAREHNRMIRDIDSLTSRTFDLIVVGGGIYGVWAALDAAQRGLSVSLLEHQDFGSGASGNSQRIIHGGLRYLQHGHLRRFRQSVRERRTLMQLAPHLVRPMSVLIPLEEGRLPRPWMMRLAIAANDFLSVDRNVGIGSRHSIGRGRMISRSECARLLGAIPHGRLVGGALIHDAQAVSTERLLMSILWRAHAHGAELANYATVTGIVRDAGRVRGVEVFDRMANRTFTVRGKVVLNCTGTWTSDFLQGVGLKRTSREYPRFLAAVLVTRPLVDDIAVAVAGQRRHDDDDDVVGKGYRNYFITPGADGRVSLVGTFYRSADRDCPIVSRDDVTSFISEFNESSGLELSPDDVFHTYAGWLPADRRATGSMSYAKRFEIIDHADELGADGLLSVIGVKWTTARYVAALAVDRVAMKAGGRFRPCRTDVTSLDDVSGLVGDVDDGDLHALRVATFVSPEAIRHAVRDEMAQSLADVVFRRTDLAAAGHPGLAVLAECARIVAEELEWSPQRVEAELAAVGRLFYSPHGMEAKP